MNYRREIRLTISNTEELYKVAKDVTDFELDNNQISNLFSATLRQVKANSGVDLPVFTDRQVYEFKDAVRGVVRDLQEEE